MLCGSRVYPEFRGLSDPVRAGLQFRQIQTSHSFALRLPSRLFVKKSLPFSSRINYLFRVWGEPQSFLSPFSMQLSTSLLLLSFSVDQLRVKLSQQVPGGPLGPCFQGLVFLKNPRLYEGWATYVQNKAGIPREAEMCWLEKAQRTHIQRPVDQWKDVQRPIWWSTRHSETEGFDTWAL